MGFQAGGCPAGWGGGEGALFNLVLGVLVVGVASLLAAFDSTGCRRALILGQIITDCHSCTSGQAGGGRACDAIPQTKHQEQGGIFLNVVVFESASILQLFARKNLMPLVRQDAFLALDFSFDILSGVTGLDLEGDGLACQGLTDTCVSASTASLKRRSELGCFSFCHFFPLSGSPKTDGEMPCNLESRRGEKVDSYWMFEGWF